MQMGPKKNNFDFTDLHRKELITFDDVDLHRKALVNLDVTELCRETLVSEMCRRALW